MNTFSTLTKKNAMSDKHHFRFHLPHTHLSSAFGNDWFAMWAEQFARFFGTPKFLIGQTVFVLLWMILNILGVFHFDPYPFILLNLAFSLQAAYAAPLILLAQTRQADRDKAHSEADAMHREELAQANTAAQTLVAEQNASILQLLEQNTQLTNTVKGLAEQIATLTQEVHGTIIKEQ